MQGFINRPLFVLALFNLFCGVLTATNVVQNERRLVDAEKRLMDKLLKNYDKKLKPADSVEIKFSLNLNQIITLIEQEQIIVLNVFLDHEWVDQRLQWDPKEFANISLTRISCEAIWTYVQQDLKKKNFFIFNKK